MFYKIRLIEDRAALEGIMIKNGYTVTPAKKKRGKGFDYGIEITGTGEDLEMEDDE